MRHKPKYFSLLSSPLTLDLSSDLQGYFYGTITKPGCWEMIICVCQRELKHSFYFDIVLNVYL